MKLDMFAFTGVWGGGGGVEHIADPIFKVSTPSNIHIFKYSYHEILKYLNSRKFNYSNSKILKIWHQLMISPWVRNRRRLTSPHFAGLSCNTIIMWTPLFVLQTIDMTGMFVLQTFYGRHHCFFVEISMESS